MSAVQPLTVTASSEAHERARKSLVGASMTTCHFRECSDPDFPAADSTRAGHTGAASQKCAQHGTYIAAASGLGLARSPIRAPDFTGRSGDQEPCESRIWCSKLASSSVACAVAVSFRASRTNKNSHDSRSPDLPVKSRSAQGGLSTPQKLLRFELRFGSPNTM
jgi:hypothetical protein